MWVTDPSRAEGSFGSDVRRRVAVLAWYPAATAEGKRASYLRDDAERATLASLLGEARLGEIAAVATHAVLDAPAAATTTFLPVLLFSPGYGGHVSAYTALLEDLASHGYIVLSINHAYESGGATLPGGFAVSAQGDDGKPRPAFLEVLREWGSEDETMAAVTRETEKGEQRRLLRQYLSQIPRTHEALRRWVDDTRLVLDSLKTLDSSRAEGRLAARMDLQRIGVFGHSMGGVTAGEFCLEDARCRAGLNLDGIPQYGTMIDRRLDRPFLMVYSARPGRAGASDPIYRRAASPYYRVDVKDTLHLDFSDMIFWGGRLEERKALGALAPARAAAITRAIVRQFFDLTLRGAPAPLLEGASSLPEVSIRRFPRREVSAAS